MQLCNHPARLIFSALACLSLTASQTSQFAAPAYAQPQPQFSSQPAPNSDVTMQALHLTLAEKTDQAKALLESTLRSQAKAGQVNGDIPNFLAIFESRDGDIKAAIRYLNDAKDAYAKSGSNDPIGQVLLTKRLADCNYQANNISTAVDLYKTALSQCRALNGCPQVIQEEIVEAMVACELQQKNYAVAETNGLALVNMTSARLKTDPMAMYSLVWALFQLADIYKETKQDSKLAQVRNSIRPLMQNLVEARMSGVRNGSMPHYNELMSQLRDHYVRDLRPNRPVEVAWAASDFRERTLPVIGWSNTVGAPVGAIICIHGLGLENRAFEFSARTFNKNGFDVYALDVRGFGSWTQTKGMDEIDYDQAIDDIGNIVSVIKAKKPGLPIFVLGESMGGAIALRAGADLGTKIDGVISSVPSAERFQQRKMTLQTSLHFLAGPNKAFDVGYVAERATSNSAMQATWKDDPKAKLQLTPIELAEFDVFMRRTKPQAEKITKIPVLIVQGLADRLVKPEGTFALFDAVTSKDKTLLLAGPAEHLMFENFSPDPILMDTVDSWLKHHLAPAAVGAAAAAAQTR